MLVYEIPCDCGLKYIGQTILTIKGRIKEHERHQSNQISQLSVTSGSLMGYIL